MVQIRSLSTLTVFCNLGRSHTMGIFPDVVAYRFPIRLRFLHRYVVFLFVGTVVTTDCILRVFKTRHD